MDANRTKGPYMQKNAAQSKGSIGMAGGGNGPHVFGSTTNPGKPDKIRACERLLRRQALYAGDLGAYAFSNPMRIALKRSQSPRWNMFEPDNPHYRPRPGSGLG